MDRFGDGSGSESTDKSTRVDVSLSEVCLAAIKNIITKSGLFNGQADFVNCAIRYYYFKYQKFAKDSFHDCIVTYPDSPRAIEQYELIMADLENELLIRSKEKFPGPLNDQVVVRLKPGLFDALFNCGYYTKQKRDVMIRIAICEYVTYMDSQLNWVHSFFRDVGNLEDRFPQATIKGKHKSLARWDKE